MSYPSEVAIRYLCHETPGINILLATEVIGMELDLVSALLFLLGKKVIDVAAGSTHCLALTEDSEVHSWGSNDQCQHFDTLHVTKPEPAALPGLDTKHIVGIACGPAQVLHI